MTLNTWNVPNVGIDGLNSYLDILESAWQDHLKPVEVNAPTVISLFAGAGGSSLGYSMAGFRELLAVEWDNNAVKTFELNFPGIPVYHGDICNLTVEQCLKIAGIKEGELDVLDGSPPCQGFSTAGKRVMNDPRNQLFREYIRLLRGLKPKVFVMENVSGMIKGKMKLIFADIMRELKASGYKVSARLLNSMYFNVPQSRQRMFFVGVREDLSIKPSHPKPQYRAISISDALGINADEGYLEYRHSYSSGGIVEFGTSDFSKPSLTLTKASNFSVKRFGDKIANINKPVGTITNLSRWFMDDKNEFSLNAYKRLASYPDPFIFTDFANGKKRIGNSVPPLFMRSIAKHIRENILDNI